ncbi:GrpB family protein [Rhodopseudomonas palustris]
MADSDVFRLTSDDQQARRAAERLFGEVTRELGSMLPASAEVLHVGATAVPGCLTKGDLDIVVRVERGDFLAVESRFAKFFPRNAGSIRSDEFAAFADAARTPHLGIQLTTKGGAFDHFHRFIAALRADPELVRRYNALKLAHHNQPMDRYRAAKHAFIAEVLRSDAASSESDHRPR